MPGGSARQGAGTLNHIETIRILATEFKITSNTPELIERLAYLTQRADQELPIAEHCDISVDFQDGEYRISGAGETDDFELSLTVTYSNLFARLHDHALRHFAGHIRIHGASGFGRDGLVVLVGDKWAGKTTLTTHLMFEGFEMVGDELVLLRDGQALTFPRPFYLRHSSMELIPQLGTVLDGAPFTIAEAEGKLVALDPLKIGRPWRIRPAPIQAVVFLEPNHGGSSRVESCSKVDMVRRVLPQSSPPSSEREDWLFDLCRTIDDAQTMVAHIGDLPTATTLFRKIFDGPERSTS